MPDLRRRTLVSSVLALPRLVSATTWSGLAITLLAVLAYGGSPWNGFVLDDHTIILDNALVTRSDVVGAFFAPYQPAGTGSDLLYRPLPVASYALQWALHGPMAAAFHALNVLLHALASVLFWRLARRIVPANGLAAFVAGALFAVHTVHTDAVSSIVGRAEILSALGVCGSFLAWLRWSAGGSHGWLPVAALLWLLGLLSKESAVALPLFVAAWTAFAQDRVRRSTLARVGALALTFGPALVVYLAARLVALDGDLLSDQSRYFAEVDLGSTVQTMLGVGARYLALLVFPSPLAPDYSFESIPLARSFLEPWPLVGLLLVPSVIVAAAVTVRGRGWPQAAGWGLLWLAVFFVPAGNVLPMMIPMAERLAYTPSFGFCLAVGAVVGRLAVGRARLVVLGVVTAWGVFLIGATVDRDRVWHDDLTLWSDALAVHPRSAIGLANVGFALEREGETKAALGAFRRAVDVAPWEWRLTVALADRLHAAGRHDEEAQLLLGPSRWSSRRRSDENRLCTSAVEMGLYESDRECAGDVSSNGLSSVFARYQRAGGP